MRTTYFQEFILWVRVTFNPCYWFQNTKQSKEWDKQLRSRMSANYKLTVNPTGHVISLGKVEVWVSNYPYAFGSDYLSALEHLPSRRTRLLLKQFLKEHAPDLKID